MNKESTVVPEGQDSLLLTFSDEAEHYILDCQVRRGQAVSHIPYSPHLSMYQHSVLIREQTGLDFGFSPYDGNRIEFFL